MAFHEEYLDVLQNIEFSIVQTYRENPQLHDFEVMRSLEALIDFYVAEKIGRNPRSVSLSDRAQLVFDNVKNVSEWRVGRNPGLAENGERQEFENSPTTIDEMIKCLKKILNSVQKWNKRGGRQGYLDFVSRYV